jgi:hypothetical protein
MSSVDAKCRNGAALQVWLGVLALVFTGELAVADEVDDAAAAWSAAGITNYSYTLTQRVVWGATSITLIEVRDGQLVAASNIIKRTNPVPEGELDKDSPLRKTISGLLNDVRNRQDFIRATFDSELGHPVNISYQNADFEEAEDQLEIRDFTVLQDGD